MEDHIIVSESEEMYLLTLAQLMEAGHQEPIPLTLLSEKLNVLPVSANQMVHRLENEGWMVYTPYKGVALTLEGTRRARQVLRRRRLWEVFLVEHLHLTPVEADALACRLEHDIPAEAAERLSEFLGSPRYSPQGNLIPDPDEQHKPLGCCPLHLLPLDSVGIVREIHTTPSGRAFLQERGISPGAELRVLARDEDGACLVRSGSNQSVQISAELANQIRIQPTGQHDSSPVASQ
jgi:DtxR family Mn-dependent transcriptional regulator